MRGGTHARGVVCRCINRKACLTLFRDVVPAIVSRGEFQIDTGLLVISRLVFDPQIGQRNFAVYNLQSVLLGDLLPPCVLLRLWQ